MAAVGLHWVLAGLLIFMLWLGLTMGDVPRGGALLVFGVPMEKIELYQLHKSLGITILLLSVVRLLVRIANPPPALPKTMQRWEVSVSKLTHWAFYVLMLGIPLLGWVLVSTSKFNSVSTILFGAIPWPHIPGLVDLTGAAKTTVNDVAGLLHHRLSWLLIVLIALHVGAALKHHFVDKDGVMARMMPWLRS